jgi:hypothetical protein
LTDLESDFATVETDIDGPFVGVVCHLARTDWLIPSVSSKT